jgi:hypothetical protein
MSEDELSECLLCLFLWQVVSHVVDLLSLPLKKKKKNVFGRIAGIQVKRGSVYCFVVFSQCKSLLAPLLHKPQSKLLSGVGRGSGSYSSSFSAAAFLLLSTV